MQVPDNAIRTETQIILEMSEDTVPNVPQKSVEIQIGQHDVEVRKLYRVRLKS
jgi:hypothetical protein